MPTKLTNVPCSSSSKLLSVLRQHPAFRHLAPEALDQLCRYAKLTVLKRGATIFIKGDPTNGLYAVVSGRVKLSNSSPDGRNVILGFVGPGDLFGELAVLDGQPRSANATANTNCEIFFIDRRDFLAFVRSQPTLATKFIEIMSARLRWTNDRIEQLILRKDLPGRLANALLGLTENRGLNGERRTIAITQQEIGEMVGMSRESINKQLGEWTLRKWVHLEHGAIEVLDASALRELAQGPD
jgi:CRP/FNR family transcriptional regulator, cyclic AMP receptor protein